MEAGVYRPPMMRACVACQRAPALSASAAMIALIQRVSEARVEVDDRSVGAIGPGLLALVAVEPDDGEKQSARMLERLLGYRVFADEAGRMNRSLADTGGGLLLVSQFTLAADTAKGMRPSFTSAASPEHGRRWFDDLVTRARDAHPGVETGEFGAHMKVSLVNDGPVTFWLQAR
jgi:D-aminoacyl-tRNA deacylase